MWLDKEIQDKVVSKAVIKHSKGILFNNYLLYKGLAALTFPWDNNTQSYSHSSTSAQNGSTFTWILRYLELHILHMFWRENWSFGEVKAPYIRTCCVKDTGISVVWIGSLGVSSSDQAFWKCSSKFWMLNLHHLKRDFSKLLTMKSLNYSQSELQPGRQHTEKYLKITLIS